MQGDVEGQARVGKIEQPGDDDEMCRARDGEEFAQTLDDPEENGVEEGHGRSFRISKLRERISSGILL
jgi:hypothetical protein